MDLRLFLFIRENIHVIHQFLHDLPGKPLRITAVCLRSRIWLIHNSIHHHLGIIQRRKSNEGYQIFALICRTHFLSCTCFSAHTVAVNLCVLSGTV